MRRTTRDTASIAHVCFPPMNLQLSSPSLPNEFPALFSERFSEVFVTVQLNLRPEDFCLAMRTCEILNDAGAGESTILIALTGLAASLNIRFRPTGLSRDELLAAELVSEMLNSPDDTPLPPVNESRRLAEFRIPIPAADAVCGICTAALRRHLERDASLGKTDLFGEEAFLAPYFEVLRRTQHANLSALFEETFETCLKQSQTRRSRQRQR